MARRTTTDTPTDEARVRPGRKPGNGIRVANDGTVTRTRVEQLGTVERIQLDTGLNRWFHGAGDHLDQRRGVGHKTAQEAAQALADHLDQPKAAVPDDDHFFDPQEA